MQRPGETIYVPQQWYHGVFNLEFTAAVTANWGSKRSLVEIWDLVWNMYLAEPESLRTYIRNLYFSHQMNASERSWIRNHTPEVKELF